MARIVFNAPIAFAPFASMLDGMWENRRDDLPLGQKPEDNPECQSFARVADALANHGGATEPYFVQIEDRDAETARTVLENLLDNSSGSTREDDPDGEMWAFDEEVEVVGGLVTVGPQCGLTFHGTAHEALCVAQELRRVMDGQDTANWLSDLVFGLEVAAQNAGLLDEHFNETQAAHEPV